MIFHLWARRVTKDLNFRLELLSLLAQSKVAGSFSYLALWKARRDVQELVPVTALVIEAPQTPESLQGQS